ncbi:hypothetical protein TcasGA2_TC013518 [Tribolium castaneum]|uniref:Uncharacterized protein n=1 Tax=Tribolium castaneum TaxID=7070 RepID=D6WL37_TRICA|nr:hypothetical protein TcasGA2_TC013518 [Tribolium castaneum]
MTEQMCNGQPFLGWNQTGIYEPNFRHICLQEPEKAINLAVFRLKIQTPEIESLRNYDLLILFDQDLADNGNVAMMPRAVLKIYQ